jgi:hypothetical protein
MNDSLEEGGALAALVIVLDFFKGDVAKHEWSVDEGEAAQKAKEEWIAAKIQFKPCLPLLVAVMEEGG